MDKSIANEKFPLRQVRHDGFFENDRCVKCGHPLGFLPDVLDLSELETAASFGVSVNPENAANNASKTSAPAKFDEQMDFESLLAVWVPLTCALNSINRGMGLSDLYPFVIPPAVVEKLRFIHEAVNPVHQTKYPAIPSR